MSVLKKGRDALLEHLDKPFKGGTKRHAYDNMTGLIAVVKSIFIIKSAESATKKIEQYNSRVERYLDNNETFLDKIYFKFFT